MFPRIEYLEWISGRPQAALHDLATSGLRGDRAVGTAIPDILEDRRDPPAGVSVETQLATAYGVDPQQVLVTAGTGHANFLALAAMIDEATESGVDTPRVLVEAPGYEPQVKTPTALGGVVDRFRRPLDEDATLDPERVTAALEPGTAGVVVTNRHNPSGRLLDRSTLASVADRVQNHEARMLVDEVYAPYVATDRGEGPFGEPTAAGLDDVVVTNSLTKFYGLGDIRVGWVIADPDFVSRARRIAYHVPSVAETSRALARRALHASDHLTERARSLLSANNDLLTAFLDDHAAVRGDVYGKASFALVDHAAVDGDRLAAAAADAGVLVVPGRFFGVSDTVRVSLGRGPDDSAASLQAFGAAIDGLSS